MNDHPTAGEATGGLVPSGVHTARRQNGKWVGALTNPPQMREHMEGAPASPPPPANTQSRTQPKAQASRGGGERGGLEYSHRAQLRCSAALRLPTNASTYGIVPGLGRFMYYGLRSRYSKYGPQQAALTPQTRHSKENAARAISPMSYRQYP